VKQGPFVAAIRKIPGFFFCHALPVPVCGIKIAAPIILVQCKRHKRVGKGRKNFAGLRLLVQKSPFYLSLLTGNGSMLSVQGVGLFYNKKMFSTAVPDK
jgi:hypothetical protein